MLSLRNRLSLFIVLMYLLLAIPLKGQFYFGRNKIQYDDFEWQVLQTDHFNLYYYEGEEELIQAAAFFAEEAFGELEQKFNYTLNLKIPLVIYSNHIHFQQTNILPAQVPEGVGGFFEFIKKRVVIPYMGDMNDFRHVIRHELVHVFTHAKIERTNGDIGAWESPNFPLWFFEGLAELWSTGWDSQAEMVIRDALLYDHLFPLDSEMLYRSGYLLYKEGQSFLGYIEQNYGAGRIRQVMEDYWQYDSFESTIESVVGKSWENLTLDWKLSLKKHVAEALNQDSMIPNGASQQTSKGTNVNPVLYTDHDGRQHILYITSNTGYATIISQELDNPKKKSSVVKGERDARRESLHILQTGLNVSANGILAYVAKSGRQDVIRLVDLKTNKETEHFRHPDLITIRSPNWSPAGDKIVFSGQNYYGTADIYIWEVGRRVIKLTDDIYYDSQPCYSPDGNGIIFSSDRGRPTLDGGMDLFILNNSENTITPLTNDKHKNTNPFWSLADSSRLYFLSDRSGTANIWSIDAGDWRNSGDSKYFQLTNFHTGIHDISVYGPDTVLASTFQKYSFQVHRLSLNNPVDSVSADPIQLDNLQPGWKVPSLDISSGRLKKPYKMEYSLDLAQTAVAYDPIYGLLGGAQLSISDLLGNRYYHFLVTNTAQSSSDFLKRFNFAVTTVNLTHRSNRAFGIFHFANNYYDPYQAFYFERSYGVRAGLNYPIDVFRRIEFSGTLWKSEKEYFYKESESALLLSNFVSFVHDNSLWYYTGPVDGWRMRMTIGPTYDFEHNRIHNLTGLFDFRYYFRFLPQVTFAQRTALWFNDGRDIRRYYIGGSWGLRGYQINRIYGRKYMMFNQEIRFPFARSLSLNFRKFGIGIAPIRGALFFDVGNAWDHRQPDMLGSFGIGVRGMFLGGIVLRWDMGKKTDFHSVDEDWFMQFFFGWDY